MKLSWTESVVTQPSRSAAPVVTELTIMALSCAVPVYYRSVLHPSGRAHSYAVVIAVAIATPLAGNVVQL